MRSFGRCLAVALVLATLVPGETRAQSSQAADLYKQALVRESTLRKTLDASPAAESVATTLLRRIRTLAESYEDMWRLFPASGYSDNALWQGAILSADAFWAYGEEADRTRGLRMLQTLQREYPNSSLLKQVPEQIARLQMAKAWAQPARPAPTPAQTSVPVAAPAVTPSPSSTTGAPPTHAVLKAIRREVLPDVLRVTLELEEEPVFHAERIDGPPRVFIDLQNTRAADALKDASLPFSDDVVRQIRVGRQLNSRTRVVLDLSSTGAGRYSVYALYNPYRIVVDFERPMAPGAKEARTEIAAKAPEPPVKSEPAVSWPAPVATQPAAPAATEGTSTAATTATAPLPPAANSTGSFSLSRQLGLGIARIVIDAGHGGHDPGAKIKGLNEADITLDVAQRLEKLLTKQGFDVVLTRRTDVFVPLEERTAIANREGADLFLSVHVNASAEPAARGIETYFLNFAPNPQAEAIAARENAGSARTMRNFSDIVRAITLNNKIDESRDFAASVQASMFDKLRSANKEVRNLGVKQAPFMVLIGAQMPSVLAEISFITNRQEGSLLKTEKYRQQIAEALFQGVLRYQQSLKKIPALALEGWSQFDARSSK